MKNGLRFIWLATLLAIAACSGGSDHSAEGEPAVRTLEIGETQTQFIAVEGEVDTYRIQAAEANRFLHVHCEEKMSGSPVDLLVTVFEEANGQRRRLFGKHKPDGAALGADLDLWVYIDSPKDLVITVRDLMDDDASKKIPYHLRATFEDSVEGNHNFSNAFPLAINAPATSDGIDEIGEVDCFTFDVAVDGVFGIRVDHHKPLDGTPVQLALSLFDRNGNLVQRLSDPYHILLSYLTAQSGPYFVMIEDDDSLNGDASAPYDISIEAVSVEEAWRNDTAEDAQRLESDALNLFTAAGAIDYASSSISPDHAGDMDWYRFTLGEVGGDPTYHHIRLTIDDGEIAHGSAPLRIAIYDADLELVTAHDHVVGEAAYQNQFRTQNGDYFLVVAPANPQGLDRTARYQVVLEESVLEDTVETGDDNTVNSAVDLFAGSSVEGWISYHSDVDWYGLAVDTRTPQILSVSLTSDTSIVDYQLSLWRGDRLIKKVTDMDGSDGPTHLKTSVLVPMDAVEATALYHFKVCDAQNNEGSSTAYTLTAQHWPVAADPGALFAIGSETLHYYSETDTEQYETDEIELEIFSTLQPRFKANSSWLDFRDPLAQGISLSEQGDGTTVITFPWICGYIDYQDDRDFFRIDLGKLDPAGTETDWYYDVQVRLVVPSPGSEVEYVWKLYRDSNRNGIIMDDPTSRDGYKACAGDTTPQFVDALDMTTPAADETFWIGSRWGEDAKFYIGVSDFNYKRLPGTNAAFDQPDNDWTYDVPYYFTVTLTYHPHQAHPE